MTIDIPSTLVIVGVGGYTSFRTFVFFSNAQFNAFNGEKLVLKSLQLGVISAVLFLLPYSFLESKFVTNKDGGVDVPALALALCISLYMVTSIIVGAVLARVSEELKSEENKSFIDSFRARAEPQYSNELEKQLLSLIVPTNKEEKEIRYSFIELKNGKIYVCLLLTLDLDDDMPINERFVTICPLRGGRRTCVGIVTFDSNYLNFVTEEIIFDKIQKGETDLEVSKKETMVKAIEDIPTITLPQLEIISLREFDESLAEKFKIV